MLDQMKRIEVDYKPMIVQYDGYRYLVRGSVAKMMAGPQPGKLGSMGAVMGQSKGRLRRAPVRGRPGPPTTRPRGEASGNAAP